MREQAPTQYTVGGTHHILVISYGLRPAAPIRSVQTYTQDSRRGAAPPALTGCEVRLLDRLLAEVDSRDAGYVVRGIVARLFHPLQAPRELREYTISCGRYDRSERCVYRLFHRDALAMMTHFSHTDMLRACLMERTGSTIPDMHCAS